MTTFYNSNLDFGNFHDGSLPLAKTVEGSEEINKWIRRGEHYPIIKLLHFYSQADVEIKVFQNPITLEVREIYGKKDLSNMENWNLILQGWVPRLNLDHVVKAYMVPKKVANGEAVLITKIIKDIKAKGYTNHHGGVRAQFDGKDLIFLEKPNRIKVYSH